MSWLIKTSYIYNAKTLRYERKRVPARVHVSKWSVLFVISVVLALGYYSFYIGVMGMEAPKMIKLKQEQAALKAGINLLNSRMDDAASRLEDIESRDNKVYRSIFGMEQIAPAVRNAGFGGIDHYAYLDHSGNKMFLNSVLQRYDVLAKKAYVQSLSFDDLEKVTLQTEKMAECVPSILPVSRTAENFHFSSAFGYRQDPKYGDVRFHRGIDIAARIGTDIHTSGSGTIAEIGYNYGGYGRYVVVDHGFGFKTYYAHLRETKVYEGQKVKRGDVIGLMGTSGKATGSHLHYEVRYMSRHMNPYNYFNNDIDTTQYQAMVNGKGHGSV